MIYYTRLYYDINVNIRSYICHIIISYNAI